MVTSPKAIKPQSAAPKASSGKSTRTSKVAMKALETSICNCASKDLRVAFGPKVRISQLAANAVGDMLIHVCSTITKKAIVLLGLANKKTVTGEAIRAAAQTVAPAISLDAQKAWADVLNAPVWTTLAKWDDKKEEEKRLSAVDNEKARINNILADEDIEIAPTVTKRIIKKCLPCGWRMKNDQPAVALAILSHLIVDIIAKNVLGNDEQFKQKLKANDGVMLAPKHIYRAVQSNRILKHIVGDHLNMVGAPVGLLEGTKKRRSGRRATRVRLEASPLLTLGRRGKRALSPGASSGSESEGSPRAPSLSPLSPMAPSPLTPSPSPSPSPSPRPAKKARKAVPKKAKKTAPKKGKKSPFKAVSRRVDEEWA